LTNGAFLFKDRAVLLYVRRLRKFQSPSMGLFYLRCIVVLSFMLTACVSIPINGAFLFKVDRTVINSDDPEDIVSIPINGAFLFKDGVLGYSLGTLLTRVSIPINGAFLFKGSTQRDPPSLLEGCFNPHQWGFFI